MRGPRPVALKLIGSIEPNKCHAGMHRTRSHNQERSFWWGDAVLSEVECY